MTAAPTAPLISKLMTFLRERRFEPGERLPSERYLSEKFGVGRNALREAIAALTALRVLESRANSGIYLKDLSAESSLDAMVLFSELGELPTAKEITDMMEARVGLELQAIALACERRTEEDLLALGETLQRTEKTLAAKGNIAELDQTFHMQLAGASHNAVIVRILHAFYRLSLARRRVYFSDLKAGRATAAQHADLVKALEQREVERARELISRHVSTGMRYWAELVDQDAKPGR